MADDNLDIIGEIQKGLSEASSQLANLNAEISKKEKAVESLSAFKRQVIATQENFNGLTSSQNTQLNSLRASSKDNLSAAEYSEGMNKTLTSFGTKFVGVALSGFLVKIEIRLGIYKAEISAAKSTIGVLSNQINNMRSDIERLTDH